MSKDFIFTRYLYEKQKVECALMLSLLHKNEEEALFWAYELYHSGFEIELVNLLWKIYYDFYASLNPSFETYLLKKTKEFTNSKTKEERNLAAIIQNLLIRPFNLDVFMLSQIQNNFEIPVPPINILLNILKETFDNETKEINVDSLLYYVFAHHLEDQSESEKLEEVANYLGQPLTVTTQKMDKIIKSNTIVPHKIILLAKILHLYGLKKNVKMGKKLYLYVEPEEVIMYETIQVDLTRKENQLISKLPAYKILPLAAIYSINSTQKLGVFSHLNLDLRKAYLDDWLYYASKSPIWLDRILRYGGKVNNITIQVEFSNEDLEEDFYNNYGYEPDEQSREVQEKSIQTLQPCAVKNFYDTLNNGRGIITLDMDYLEQISTFSTF
jgi:hypothetical protein